MAKKLEDYKWLCPEPFVNLTTQTTGAMMPCCCSDIWENHEHELKNVETDSFEEYYNSDLIKKMRQSMKSGNRDFLADICKRCIKQEENGLVSQRQSGLKKYYNEFKDKREELERIIDEECMPTFIQTPTLISLGQGQCNLKCGMCDDFTSSARRRESIELEEIPKDFPKVRVKHGEKFYKDLDWILENCLEFELPLAEPLMVKNNYKILKKLDKSKTIKVVTNGTINVDKFIDHVKDFKYTEINVSIEGGKKVNEYIRYPSKWETIIENFDKLSSLKNSNVTFMSTTNALNLGKFTQLRKDIQGRQWHQGGLIGFNDKWTAAAIPDDVKEIYLNDLYEFGNKAMISYVENSVYDEKLMIELMIHCRKRDKLRKAYLPDVFPEWTKYYENCSS